MWQAETFDAAAIDRELGFAAQAGFEAVRVFLHDLAWRSDPAGFRTRLGRFLAIADRHAIATMPVLFDSCWDPFPRAGRQPAPRRGVHNSRWVQSPGAAALGDRRRWPDLRAYVSDVVGAFATDRRLLAWDVWNEPDNLNSGSYGAAEPPDKLARVAELLPLAFAWTRNAGPTQPLTSPLWHGDDWSKVEALSPVQRIQVEASDVLSFHDYGPAESFAARLRSLAGYGRPVLCTEYMARPLGSTFAAILPLAGAARVPAFNWGLVAGATQTYLPWSTWQVPSRGEPCPWFHDVFHADGRPYRADEVALIRTLAAAPAAARR